jgi:ribosomal-protein-serine acetyltransferase
MFRFALSDAYELRLLEESDVDELYGVVEANRGYLAHWMPWAERQTLENTLAFIRLTRTQLAHNDGFQAALVAHQRIIGCVGFHKVDWSHRSSSIGYWLAADQQGRGTMTLAVAALVDWAFGAWKLNRLEIKAAIENDRSRAIPARLGFREEGTLRQAERVGDRYLDHVVYSMLAEDWAARTGDGSPQPALRDDDGGPFEPSGS